MKNSWKKVAIFSALLLLTGCEVKLEGGEEYKEVLKVSGTGESIDRNYYKVDDDTIIYTAFDTIKYEDSELNEALASGSITIDKLLEKMVAKDSLNDGGSKYYQDGNVYVTVCDSLEGNGNNHNIYISNIHDNPLNICSFDITEHENCVINDLTSLITSKKVSTKNGKITSLTSNKNYESVTYKKSSLGEFVLIKTNDENLIKDLKAYFKKKNKKYYYTNFTYYANEKYNVFFYNSKNSDAESKINACINK